jgi:predicted nuclease with TOPRIM domain
LRIQLQYAMTQIQELIAERTYLQQDNSQLKIDLHEMRERFSSFEGKLHVCDSSLSFIEKLRLEKAALVTEFEELEFSAQRQVDSWQAATATAKNEVHELSITVDNLKHKNQLLLLSLENKVAYPHR